MAKTPYELELENLIKTQLLPKYIKYHQWIGHPVDLGTFPPQLVEGLQHSGQIPALLQPKKIRR
ncbi:MAG: hypothetical protein ACK5S6_01860 [bacterium]|jgi:hypothetical protein